MLTLDCISDIDTASIVSSQCSEISTASVPMHARVSRQMEVNKRGHPEVIVRRSSSRHMLPVRPKSLSMSIHTVQFEKGILSKRFQVDFLFINLQVLVRKDLGSVLLVALILPRAVWVYL